jgi:transposase
MGLPLEVEGIQLPEKRLSMRKIKEVLRLRHELGLHQEQIARSCSIGQSTVHRYLERAEAAQLVWPLAEDWDDAKIEQLLFPVKVGFKAAASAPIDFAGIHQELVSHKYLTLQLLWEEYKQSNPAGYQYSWFCQRYRDWLKTRDLVLRQDHRAGEKLFVDHAGGTIPVIGRGTGEVEPAYVFVAVMGASSYTYVEASMHRDLPSWIGAHIRAFEFFQGCPLAVVPDNWKTAVNRACRYMPDVNVTYQEMAAHYGVAVVPARPRKPRDKAKVEAGVQVAGRWLVAALRKRQFFSVGEVNEALAELLPRLNEKPFQKRSGCRRELFATLDRPALRPLPAIPYCIGEWKTIRVNRDYHVAVNSHFYSVPYQLVGQQVEARSTSAVVELFYQGRRVASHIRGLPDEKATSINEHRPKAHLAHLEWTPTRLLEWAAEVGPFTAQLADLFQTNMPHPEMGYRACMGMRSLAKKFTPERLEAAATRAMRLGIHLYSSVRLMLEHEIDRLPLKEEVAERPAVEHDNIRGAEYFDGGPDDVESCS